MKKVVTLTVTALLATTALCGCGKTPTAQTAQPPEPLQLQTKQQTEVKQEPENNTEITLDGNKTDGFHGEAIKKGVLSGVRRHFRPDHSGSYTVEYIHTPYGIDEDETLDYRLTLNDDNTFSLTVVSNGVTAEHSGRWYERRKEIIMFYDEEIDPPQHNVYIADSMYGDILPKGKIMIYDNCCTIVLSRQIAINNTDPAQQ
ncbi:MAG: hypothetical protein K2L88_01945 [Clostridiales bacterium]|nr:hypothetical protein [Clostridiales bacterium]